MQSLEPWVSYALVFFGSAYVILAIMRLWLLRNQIRALGGVAAARNQQADAQKTQNSSTATRIEAIQRAQEEHRKQWDIFFQGVHDQQERWAAILSRLEALAEKAEKRSDA